MPDFPSTVRVTLRRNGKAGLFAAVSDDLPGLMTVANSIEEIERRLPAAVAQLIDAQYGVKVEIEIHDDEPGNDFKSLADPRVIGLRVA